MRAREKKKKKKKKKNMCEQERGLTPLGTGVPLGNTSSSRAERPSIGTKKSTQMIGPCVNCVTSKKSLKKGT